MSCHEDMDMDVSDDVLQEVKLERSSGDSKGKSRNLCGEFWSYLLI